MTIISKKSSSEAHASQFAGMIEASGGHKAILIHLQGKLVSIPIALLKDGLGVIDGGIYANPSSSEPTLILDTGSHEQAVAALALIGRAVLDGQEGGRRPYPVDAFASTRVSTTPAGFWTRRKKVAVSAVALMFLMILFWPIDDVPAGYSAANALTLSPETVAPAQSQALSLSSPASDDPLLAGAFERGDEVLRFGQPTEAARPYRFNPKVVMPEVTIPDLACE